MKRLDGRMRIFIGSVVLALGVLSGCSDDSMELVASKNEVTSHEAATEKAREAVARVESGPLLDAAVSPQVGPQIGDPLYPHESKEGIAWLQKHGFPTSQEFNSIHGRAPQISSINLDDGISAMELLDLEQLAGLDKDGKNEAAELLNKAAAMGSMYALEVLGRVYQTRGNYVWSEAYFEASRLRGNWAAATRIKPRLSDADEMLASIMAQQIIDKANAARRKNGLPPLTHDSRPGAEVMVMALSEQIRIERESQGK